MDKITPLSECTFDQAVQVWNSGFEGYFANITLTTDQFMKRLVTQGLSPDLSIVAWKNGKPIGCVLNGIRTISGKRVAWNGGTAVVPEYRRTGVGRRMMDACLDVYRGFNVDVAYLEALVDNGPAIALYEQCGYHIVDSMTCLVRTGPLPAKSFHSHADTGYMKIGPPSQVLTLPFYTPFATWQNQWQSVAGGQSIILFDPNHMPVAYALFKHAEGHDGTTESITLNQCEVATDSSNQREVVRQLLSEVFVKDEADFRRIAFNIPTSNSELIDILVSAGFTPFADQVSMMRFMKE